MNLYALLRPLLFQLEPENAHTLTLKSLNVLSRMGLGGWMQARAPSRPLEVMGLEFPNPVGLAAGLDKNGDYVDALASLGFGFLEIGTITPRAQPGNAKPRMFRVTEANGIINRMGFNNQGVDYMIEKLKRVRYRGILGINIGKNFDTPIENAAQDYLTCLRKVYPFANYITVNVSSPNTRNLRELQEHKAMGALLEQLKTAQSELHSACQRYVPLAIKIAPDLDENQISQLANLFLQYEVDAVIATNTTISREQIQGLPHCDENGGLSGEPLFDQSTHVTSLLCRHLNSKIPVIACGGIMKPEDALRKKSAGASLVQLYSGLIYLGPNLIADTIKALDRNH